MTLRDMNLRVFRREPIPRVFFQPRFEPWFDRHRQFASLPEELEGATLREAYDRIGASMRTVHYYTGQPNPIVTEYDGVTITTEESNGVRTLVYETPHGSLTEIFKFTVDRTWRRIGFPAKDGGDLRALLWLVERKRFGFSAENFAKGAAYIGERGVPQFWVPKSPYFDCAQHLFRYEDFIFALADEPAMMGRIMDAIDRSYDALYDELTGSGVLEILNFGENVDMAYLSPDYFERYVMPWYEKRVGQLRAAGIHTHVHIDGYFRPLLPYLAKLPFDGLEALTPLPQGDVTLEEMADAMGDKILLDGIPAILFLEHHPREELQACVARIVELFHPRLVLGISDELPEGGNDESWERLKWVADWCRVHPQTTR